MYDDYAQTRLHDNGVFEVMLSSPESGNRFTTNGLHALLGVATQAKERGARAFLLTHHGNDFCLGGQLSHDGQHLNQTEIQAFASALQQWLWTLFTMDIPVVCAVSGRVEGGGLSFAQACDLVFASPEATFAIPEILNNMPPVVSFASASLAFQPQKLMTMAMLGEKVPADEAMRLGLVSAVYPKEKLVQAVMGHLATLLAKEPAAIQTIKAMKRAFYQDTFEKRVDIAIAQLIAFFKIKESDRR